VLATDVYSNNVKLIAVDEAHCISHWGFSPRKGEKIFCVWFYSRIKELRSIVPGSVPLLALTATATKRTRERVMHALEMKNATIKDFPDKPNITYSVQIVGTKTLETFHSLIAEVEQQGGACDRVIIYCQTIKITMIYAHFQAELGQNMYKGNI
jgi:ATP-dependent DNA helicase RecQ